jgi:hypothetical protein
MTFPLRMPDDVKAWVMATATQQGRSQNSQIVWVLRQAMAATAASTSEETGASVSQTSAPASRVTPEGLPK